MNTSKAIRCASCKKEIPDHESDVVLRRADTEERVFFHTSCAGGAMAMVMLEPDVWLMTVRHVDASRN